MREWNKQVSVACAKAKQRDDPDGSSSVGGPAVNKRFVWRLRLGSSPKESKNKTSNKMFSDDDGGVFLRENDFPGAASGKNSNHHSDVFVLLSLSLSFSIYLCQFGILFLFWNRWGGSSDSYFLWDPPGRLINRRINICRNRFQFGFVEVLSPSDGWRFLSGKWAFLWLKDLLQFVFARQNYNKQSLNIPMLTSTSSHVSSWQWKLTAILFINPFRLRAMLAKRFPLLIMNRKLQPQGFHYGS